MHKSRGHEQFQRFAALHPSDWYFNRALKDVLVACKDRFNDAKASRTWNYWLKSAWRYVQAYQKLSASVPSFEKRKLLKKPMEEHSKLMLGLRSAKSLSAVSEITRRIYQHYETNCSLFDDFIHEESRENREALLLSARKSREVSLSVIRVLKAMPHGALPVTKI